MFNWCSWDKSEKLPEGHLSLLNSEAVQLYYGMHQKRHGRGVGAAIKKTKTEPDAHLNVELGLVLAMRAKPLFRRMFW